MLKEVNLCRVSETNGTNRSCDSERGLETAYVVNGSLFVRLFKRTDLLGVSKVAGKLPGFEKWNLENEKRSQECWYPKTRLQITDGTAKCVGNYWMKFMIVLVIFILNWNWFREFLNQNWEVQSDDLCQNYFEKLFCKNLFRKDLS